MPTYNQMNKTQKNNNNLKKKVTIQLENNVYNNENIPEIKDNIESDSKLNIKAKTNIKSELESESEPELESESNIQFNKIFDKKINNLENNKNNSESLEKLKEETNKIFQKDEIIPLSNKPSTNEIAENNILNTIEINNDQDITLQNIPKIKRITRKSTYKLGKINGKNKVGILVKNRETQKNIKHEVSILKQKPIQDIKNYLRSKNLIKVGSNAPNDVLKKIYEDSILSGEIINTNNNNMIYNYLNN